jgi:N-acetylmuramoyl-L-alanine amidase
LELTGTKTTRRPRLVHIVWLFFSLLSWAGAQPVIRAEAQDYEDYSRVIITFPTAVSYSLEKDESFLQVRIQSAAVFRLRSDPVKSQFIKAFRWARASDVYIVAIETQHARFRYDSFRIENRRQLVIDFYPEAASPATAPSEAIEKPTEKPAEKPAEVPNKEESQPPAEAAAPPPKLTSSAPKSVRTIVIDPGHGGLEVGAKGKFGTLEKDVTLAVSLKLKALIERNLVHHVELTRDKDMNVSLENRAAIANNHRAELFISVHANSSFRRNANGSETFFLSLNATDEEARRLAYLENNATEFEKPLDEQNKDELMMILWDMAQSAYLKQSQRLAEIIQDELNSLLGTANRGIKQAPFKVLTGVACPAVLVEVAFISNPDEEKELVTDEFQQKIAEAIYGGLVRYLKLTS